MAAGWLGDRHTQPQPGSPVFAAIDLVAALGARTSRAGVQI